LAAQATHTDSLSGQRDLVDVMLRIIGKPPDTSTVGAVPPSELRLSVLPNFSVEPTVGVLFGVVGFATKRFGAPETTKLSQFSAGLFYTTKKQYGVDLLATMFSREDRFLGLGDWRFEVTSEPTYGLGGIHPESALSDMNFSIVRLDQSVLRRVGKELFVGGGYMLSRYFSIVDHRAAEGPTPFSIYNGGQTVTATTSSGLSATALYDGRDNPVNAAHGIYAHARVIVNPTWLGSDDNWQSVMLDVRGYPHPGGWERGTLALRGFSWLTFGHAPYYDLPATGWDREGKTARGYPRGRIRGSKMVYGEAEYRVEITSNGLIGAASFLNFLTMEDPESGRFGSVDPAFGVGLRLKFDKHNKANITFDYGVGREGARGLFLGLGEDF
jgi:hypothetical protein